MQLRELKDVEVFRRFAWLLSDVQQKEVNRLVSSGVKEYMRSYMTLPTAAPALKDDGVRSVQTGGASSSSSASAHQQAIMPADAMPQAFHDKEAAKKAQMEAKKRELLSVLW